MQGLTFWILRRGFWIPGTGFLIRLIPWQWNLDSGLQSLAGFRIFLAELWIRDSGLPYMGEEIAGRTCLCGLKVKIYKGELQS